LARNRLLVRVGPRAKEAVAGDGPRTPVRGICTVPGTTAVSAAVGWHAHVIAAAPET